jgi:triacylglycerol lipase
MAILTLRIAAGALALAAACGVEAACIDNIVLVHGNAGNPSDFNNTYNALRARGWAANQIFRPSWGSKTCAACNDHAGSEQTPVENALIDAIASSCTGRIDVIGHSMGVTLAAREIDKFALKPYVDSFVGIAGAYRGLWSCGTYPWNFLTSTCGSQGLSIGSPLLTGLAGKKPAARAYSIKSWSDQIVCSTGVCTVGGVHSSTVPGENASYTYLTGHFGLLTNTASKQVDLVQ